MKLEDILYSLFTNQQITLELYLRCSENQCTVEELREFLYNVK